MKEAIIDEQTGLLVEFLLPDDVANKTIRLLEEGALRARLGKEARTFAIDHYDLRRVCLPKMLEIIAETIRR
jgi:glycosyltransferase involved in cell wall biosynthesis